MKIIAWIIGLLVVISGAFFGLQQLASERIEVVELVTVDAAGSEVVTRLWVVDDEGFAYLRSGNEASGWFSRLQAKDTFKVTRGDETASYTAVLRTDKRERINQLMQDKYTWGDTFIGMTVSSRANSIPVELHRVSIQ